MGIDEKKNMMKEVENGQGSACAETADLDILYRSYDEYVRCYYYILRAAELSKEEITNLDNDPDKDFKEFVTKYLAAFDDVALTPDQIDWLGVAEPDELEKLGWYHEFIDCRMNQIKARFGYSSPQLYMKVVRCQQLYSHIHEKQPQILIDNAKGWLQQAVLEDLCKTK